MVSIIILTFNEAQNISDCLDSVGWCDNVVIVDSFSTDKTREIATSLGAQVVTNGFESFAQQRNFAMELPSVKYDWVFHLDADERFTPALRLEIFATLREPKHSGYFVPSKMMLFGRWLKRAAGYPVYQVRLVNRREMQFTQHGHGQREGEATKGYGYLKQPYIHYSFSAGFEQWAHKHNKYSSLEAQQECSSQETRIGNLFGPDPSLRRRTIRDLSKRLPGRPFVKFVYLYLVKGGFLDGKPGLTYCLLQAIYEYLIVLKGQEIRLRLRGQLP